MKIEEFTSNMRVAYVPLHDPTAKKYGTVSSVNSKYVFVRFDEQVARFGWDRTTSQACDPEDLILV